MGYAEVVHKLNVGVAQSRVGYWFRLDGSGHRKERKNSYFFTEIRAGLSTFFAMAYIIAVNSSIVADSGGTCVCNGGTEDPECNANEEYTLCLQALRRDLVTATAAIACLGSFCMGLFANLPVGIAPGMGLNAYFTYTVVGRHGTGPVPYRVALTAIFIEGFIFFGLTILGIRQWLARAIPRSVKLATGVGIGFYLTIIGIAYGQGLGLVTGATSTPLELAGCAPEFRRSDGTCPSSEKMRNPTLWIGIFCGGIFTVLLMLYRVKGAILIGIILVSIISWPRGTDVTYFPYTAAGDDAFNFFKKVVDFHPIKSTLVAQDWNVAEYGGQFGLALITFLYVDILDATGTLYAMARFANLIDERTQDFEGSSVAYMVDALSSTIGSLFGVPTAVAFVESGAGISEGGKTGITSMTTGLCFFVAVFFAPIFASIPAWATGPVLVLVGSMMVPAVTEINWRYLGDAIPAFLTIVLMPFTYSIADGLIGGICSYIALNTIAGFIKFVSKGKILPLGYADKDPWTWRVAGGFFPPWTRRLAKGKKDFWREDHDSVVENTTGREEIPTLEKQTSSDRLASTEAGRGDVHNKP